MISHAVKELPGHFIDPAGKVYKIVSGKEVEVIPFKSKKSGRLYFVHEKKDYDYLMLMIKYFHPEIKATHKIKYKVGKNGRIAASSIRTVPFLGKEGLT